MSEQKFTAGFSLRSKVWIVDEAGDLVFGPGRLRILETVQECGSILAAAKHLNMSYRAVWGKIKATEKRLGAKLLYRSVGGSSGGGSELTPFALELISEYRRLNLAVQIYSDNFFLAETKLDLPQDREPSEENDRSRSI
ncbi:MAG: LysR family transcriptional regulator [Deltaproteobacteria bacterium]|nr:LysR family transcriptional regulator [Deltaproteobacteria bacterium]